MEIDQKHKGSYLTRALAVIEKVALSEKPLTPTEINNVVSVGGVTATLPTVRLNVPVLLPLKVPEMSSNFL